jgi:hypothetical protein
VKNISKSKEIKSQGTVDEKLIEIFKGLTHEEQGAILFGETYSKAIGESLLRKGLVGKFMRDCIVYEVPIYIHMKWCAYCATLELDENDG